MPYCLELSVVLIIVGMAAVMSVKLDVISSHDKWMDGISRLLMGPMVIEVCELLKVDASCC